MMNSSNAISSSIAAPAPVEPAELSHGIFDVSATMVVWTWVTFFIVAFILHRLAWKPVVSTLEQREQRIRRSIDDAEKARQAAADANTRRDAVLREASTTAQSILDEGRSAAAAAARIVEHKSREEARIAMDAARNDIVRAQEQARRQLTADTAALAVELAAKVVREQMRDPVRQQLLTEQLIRELRT